MRNLKQENVYPWYVPSHYHFIKTIKDQWLYDITLYSMAATFPGYFIDISIMHEYYI